ncbi:hypothetical protein [Pontibacter rugosus]
MLLHLVISAFIQTRFPDQQQFVYTCSLPGGSVPILAPEILMAGLVIFGRRQYKKAWDKV